MEILKISPEGKQAIAVGRENHWRFKIVGSQGMIDNPVYRFGWWYIPFGQDDSKIPTKAKKRVEAIHRAGLPIQGLIVSHEAPLLLPGPPKEEMHTKVKRVGKRVARESSKGLMVAGTITVAVLKTMLEVAAAIAIGMAQLVGAALVLVMVADPALIVVLEDGTWIEVMSWYD